MSTDDAILKSEVSRAIGGGGGVFTAVVLSAPLWLALMLLTGEISFHRAKFGLLALLFGVMVTKIARRIRSP